MRDRKQTEQDIISAVDRIIAQDGFKSLGINAIAKEANVSKVLIYRYFNDLDGLLEEWAIKNSYWVANATADLSGKTVKESIKEVMTGYGSILRNDPVRREILRWLMVEESNVCRKIMEKNEEAGLRITKGFEKHPGYTGDIDAEAIFALISAGISYLALSADRANVLNGVPLDSAEGWNRIMDSVNLIVDSLIE